MRAKFTVNAEFPAQRVLAATFIPGSLWTRVQLPPVFSAQPFLVELLLLFKLTTSAVKPIIDSGFGQVIE
jgi:hypothetical protein